MSTEKIELTIKNLFFEGGVTMSKESFIQILQYALDKDIVTVRKKNNKYIVSEKKDT